MSWCRPLEFLAFDPRGFEKWTFLLYSLSSFIPLELT